MTMVALVLDENISPALSPRLWAKGIDNYHVRDRGLLQVSDPFIWKMAQEQERTVVTITAGDFWKLSTTRYPHCGVVVIPSGGNRDEQFEYVMAGLDWAKNTHATFHVFQSRFVEVSENFSVSDRAPLPALSPAEFRGNKVIN